MYVYRQSLVTGVAFKWCTSAILPLPLSQSSLSSILIPSIPQRTKNFRHVAIHSHSGRINLCLVVHETTCMSVTSAEQLALGVCVYAPQCWSKRGVFCVHC